MKRILFDANVPFKCRVFLAHHEVHTAQRIGWRLKENGDLIRSAERAGYDVLVSCDQNIEYQQNLKERTISIVILSTNKRAALMRAGRLITAAVEAATPGSYTKVDLRQFLPPRKRRARPDGPSL